MIPSIPSNGSSLVETGPMGTTMERNRVLIVDDDPAIRRVVSALLDLDEIADGAGSQFDPLVVDAFTTIVPDLPGFHASLHTGGPHTGGPTPGLWTA